MPKSAKKYSARTHFKLEDANVGTAFTAEQKRVKIAYRRDSGVPDHFLDDGRPLRGEDVIALGLGHDTAKRGGVFTGVDFDEHGRIVKE